MISKYKQIENYSDAAIKYEKFCNWIIIIVQHLGNDVLLILLMKWEISLDF